MVIANGSESGNENKRAEGKKQELFVKVFRFCLPVPISSNYPHLTFCFLNKGYLHPSLTELTAIGSAGFYQSLIRVYPTSELTHGSGTHNSATARDDLPFSMLYALHRRTDAILSTILLASARARRTLPILGIQRAVPKARKEPSFNWAPLSFNWDLLSSWDFLPIPAATPRLCLCPSLQPPMRTLTRCLGFPSSASNLPCR